MTITFQLEADVAPASLKEGDLISILGNLVEGDRAVIEGRVRAAGYVTSNTTIVMANGLKAELFPGPGTFATEGYVNENIPNRSGLTFETVAKAKTGTTTDGTVFALTSLPEFTRIEWQGYYAQSDGGSNWGRLRFGVHTDDGGSIFSIDANTYIEANMIGTGRISAKKWGLKGDGVDEDSFMQTFMAYVRAGARTAYFPVSGLGTGQYAHTTTISYDVSDMCIEGENTSVVLQYLGAGTGVAVNLSDASPHRLRWELRNIALFSATGARALNFTAGSYGTLKNVLFNYTAANAEHIYAKGHNGAGPYYNNLKSFICIGGADRTQIGVRLASDSSGNLADGPNANQFSNIKRLASLARGIDLIAGTGNQFVNVSGESISDAMIVLNDVPSAKENGTVTSAASSSLTDNTKTWSTAVGNPLNFTNDAVKITSGTYIDTVRRITANTVDTLELDMPFPDDIGTPSFIILAQKAVANTFTNIRQEGLASENPDGIRVMPGARSNEATGLEIGSIGSGMILADQSGDPSNAVHQGELVTKQFILIDVVANQNIELVPRSSVFGGIREGSRMVLEHIEVQGPTFVAVAGAEATITVDHGGSVTGNGTHTVVAKINQFNPKRAFTPNPDKTGISTRTAGIFVNLQTNGLVNPSSDYIITVAYRIK